MRYRPLFTLCLALGASPALVAGRANAQRPTGDLLALLNGNDTISVERFTRTRERLDVEMLIKAAGARFSFTVLLGPDGGATRLENAYRQASAEIASTPTQSAVVRFSSDSAIAEITGASGTVTQRFATRPGVVPFLNPSFSLVELAIQRARIVGGDSVAVPIWSVQGGSTVLADVIRSGPDSVVVKLGGIPVRLAVNANGDIIGGVIPSQGLRIVRSRGGDAAAMAVEKPDYTTPAGAPYTAEEVTIHTPMGHTLAGTLTRPTGARGPVPAVVTITGSGPEDRDEAIPPVKGYRPFRQIADTLALNGIAVLRMDDRGVGASTGDHGTATSADFANDIRAGLAYLRTRPEIDATRLGLIGHSEGGLIAPMVAAEAPALRGIVLLAGPAQTGRTILRFQLRFQIEGTPTLTATQKDSAFRTIDATIDSLGAAQPWMKFFLDYDPVTTARRVRVPTLILQGQTDRQVTFEQAETLERAMRAAGNNVVTRRVFPQTNHLFVQDADGNPAGYTRLPNRNVRSDVLAAVVDFFRLRMK